MRTAALDREEAGQVGLNFVHFFFFSFFSKVGLNFVHFFFFNFFFAKVGVAVFLPLYPRVVSWLQEKLGSYQNVVLAKASR